MSLEKLFDAFESKEKVPTKSFTDADYALQWCKSDVIPLIRRPPSIEIHRLCVPWTPTQDEIETCQAIDEVVRRMLRHAFRDARHPVMLKSPPAENEFWIELDTREHARLVPYLKDFPFVQIAQRFSGDAVLRYGQLEVLIWECKSPSDAAAALENFKLETQRAELTMHPLPHCQKEFIFEQEEWFAEKKQSKGRFGRPYDRAEMFALASEIRQVQGFRTQILRNSLYTILHMLSELAMAVIAGCKFVDRARASQPSCASLQGEVPSLAALLAKQEKFNIRSIRQKNDPSFWMERSLHLVDNIPLEAPKHIVAQYGCFKNLINAVDKCPTLKEKCGMFKDQLWATRLGKPSRFGPKRAERLVFLLTTSSRESAEDVKKKTDRPAESKQKQKPKPKPKPKREVLEELRAAEVEADSFSKRKKAGKQAAEEPKVKRTKMEAVCDKMFDEP